MNDIFDLRLLAAVLVLFIAPLPFAPAAPPTIDWIKQFGTSGIDRAYGVATDKLLNAYVVGDAIPSGQGSSAFVNKYSADGALLWSRQFDVSDFRDIAVDKSDNFYIAGNGILAGPGYGNGEALVAKYVANGALQWMHQIGTPQVENGTGVAVDPLGNVYLSGTTSGNLAASLNGYSDAFVSKFDPSGSLLWTRQWGISLTDEGNDVAVDSSGNVYVSGSTYNFLSDPYPSLIDAFVNKYDTNGNLVWTRLSGQHSESFSYGVSVDNSGDIYQTGYTATNVGGPNAGGFSGTSDAFVIKYDPSGAVLWKKEWGTTSNEVTTGISADALGGIYISGYTDGGVSAVYGNKGYYSFLSKLDAAGNLIWSLQSGSGYGDVSFGVSADSLGNAYFVGRTEKTLSGIQYDNEDAILIKIHNVPEPASLIMFIVGVACVACQRYGPRMRLRHWLF
jgi:hypothetical protein